MNEIYLIHLHKKIIRYNCQVHNSFKSKLKKNKKMDIEKPKL